MLIEDMDALRRLMDDVDAETDMFVSDGSTGSTFRITKLAERKVKNGLQVVNCPVCGTRGHYHKWDHE